MASCQHRRWPTNGTFVGINSYQALPRISLVDTRLRISSPAQNQVYVNSMCLWTDHFIIWRRIVLMTHSPFFSPCHLTKHKTMQNVVQKMWISEQYYECGSYILFLWTYERGARFYLELLEKINYSEMRKKQKTFVKLIYIYIYVSITILQIFAESSINSTNIKCFFTVTKSIFEFRLKRTIRFWKRISLGMICPQLWLKYIFNANEVKTEVLIFVWPYFRDWYWCGTPLSNIYNINQCSVFSLSKKNTCLRSLSL